MRSDAPGIVLDATALTAAPASTYVQALIRVCADLDRPIVVPAAALVAALASGSVDAADFDPPHFHVTALTQATAPALAYIIATATAPIGMDTAHAAYEAASTGFPIITTRGDAYSALRVPVDLEELP